MEQTSKYFSKTANSLHELKETLAELNLAQDNAATTINKQASHIVSLKEHIKEQSARIDSIIENLQGALNDGTSHN